MVRQIKSKSHLDTLPLSQSCCCAPILLWIINPKIVLLPYLLDQVSVKNQIGNMSIWGACSSFSVITFVNLYSGSLKILTSKSCSWALLLWQFFWMWLTHFSQLLSISYYQTALLELLPIRCWLLVKLSLGIALQRLLSTLTTYCSCH